MEYSSDHRRGMLLEFLRCYRSLPVLWDVSSANYYNRKNKAHAYRLLLAKYRLVEPNANRECVVRKINSMRSAFRKEMRKISLSLERGETYEPSLWYFNELQFLNGQNRSGPDSPDRNEGVLDIEAFTAPQGDSDLSEAQASNDVTTPVAESIRIETTERSSDENKISVASRSEGEEDEFLTIAKGFAYKLKRMSSLQRLFADRLVNEVLLEGQLGNLKRYSSILIEEARSPLCMPVSSGTCLATGEPPNSTLSEGCIVKEEYD